MKLRRKRDLAVGQGSLPAWGVWIEISTSIDLLGIARSLPAWGVWIEMFALISTDVRLLRRSPHGECGLKLAPFDTDGLTSGSLPAWGVWIEIFKIDSIALMVLVAPRMGSVD